MAEGQVLVNNYYTKIFSLFYLQTFQLNHIIRLKIFKLKKNVSRNLNKSQHGFEKIYAYKKKYFQLKINLFLMFVNYSNRNKLMNRSTPDMAPRCKSLMHSHKGFSGLLSCELPFVKCKWYVFQQILYMKRLPIA